MLKAMASAAKTYAGLKKKAKKKANKKPVNKLPVSRKPGAKKKAKKLSSLAKRFTLKRAAKMARKK